MLRGNVPGLPSLAVILDRVEEVERLARRLRWTDTSGCKSKHESRGQRSKKARKCVLRGILGKGGGSSSTTVDI